MAKTLGLSREGRVKAESVDWEHIGGGPERKQSWRNDKKEEREMATAWSSHG
jgi:hypothetical protein